MEGHDKQARLGRYEAHAPTLPPHPQQEHPSLCVGWEQARWILRCLLKGGEEGTCKDSNKEVQRRGGGGRKTKAPPHVSLLSVFRPPWPASSPSPTHAHACVASTECQVGVQAVPRCVEDVLSKSTRGSKGRGSEDQSLHASYQSQE